MVNKMMVSKFQQNIIMNKLLDYAKSDVFYIKQGLSNQWKVKLFLLLSDDLFNIVYSYKGEGTKDFIEYFKKYKYATYSNAYYSEIREVNNKSRITRINTSTFK